MDSQHRNLIWKVLDRQATAEEFDTLQRLLQQDSDVQLAWLNAVELSEALIEIGTGSDQSDGTSARVFTPDAATPTIGDATAHRTGSRGPAAGDRLRQARWWLAAAVLISVAFASFRIGLLRGDRAGDGSEIAAESPAADNTSHSSNSSERLIAGHATLRRAVGMTWGKANSVYHEGDLLSAGQLAFDSGLAEIDFFCGATVLVEGPARLQIESDWSLGVLQGRLRVTVPPAAEGFIVRAADSQIIDLGTEFAVDVSGEQAAVKVIDGEVRLEGGRHDGLHLKTGEEQSLQGDARPLDESQFRTVEDVQRRRGTAADERFRDWKASVQQLQTDDRLIAYFPIALHRDARTITNAALTGSAHDGLVLGPVESVSGRFGSQSTGLAFGRPGARVRTRIDGEFRAFTFAAWVRIDSLEHRYNALFMGDGYENGEPHWQIRDDGRLMFSVMVDDTQDVRHFNSIDQQVVRDAGLHRVYMSQPIWDLSRSGQWFHLAATYDPAERTVRQFVNGRQVSEEPIIDRFHVTKLRIGPAEIGNWGQPFRKTPWFAVRNLNGIIDELAIFNAALSPDEIAELHSNGRPPGY